MSLSHIESNIVPSEPTPKNKMLNFFNCLNALDESHEWRLISPKGIKQLKGKPEDLFDQLQEFNSSGYEIFVTINQTDGHGVKATNIKKVRACFADFDGAPLENLERIALPPSFIVNTSPGKHHAYWVMDDCPCDEFKKMQQSIATLLESDPAVCDLGRVMRVPGFLHLKGSPYLVDIDVTGEVKSYSYSRFIKALSNNISLVSQQPSFSLEAGCIEGNRHNVLTHLAGKLIHQCIDDDDATAKLLDWNKLNSPPLTENEVLQTYFSIKATDEVNHGEERRILRDLDAEYAIVSYGGKTLIVRENPLPTFMGVNDFHLLNAHKKIGNKPATKIWLQSDQTRRFDSVDFYPGKIKESNTYNLYQGLPVSSRPGKCDLILKHISEVICSSNVEHYNYVLGWMAHAIQKPAEMPGVALVLRGSQGTGKGTFAQYFGKLFGSHFLHVTHMQHLLGQFNSHLATAIVVFGDETVWGGNKREEGQLKAMITEPRRVMEAKFKDPITVKSYSRFVFATNEDWAVPTGPKERRFCVLDVSDSKAKKHDYFVALANEMSSGGAEALLYFLKQYDLSSFDVRDYPETNALLDQKLLSLPSVAKWWLDVLTDGILKYEAMYGITHQNNIFEDELSTQILFNSYKEHIKNERYGHGQANTSQQFVGTIKKWAPCESGRMIIDSGRHRTLKFPSLDICREYFETQLGQPHEWN